MTPDERLARLGDAESAGEPIDLLMFWGHKPAPNGATGTGCLSQWRPAPFTVDGLVYPTAEHWMMAEKARLFADDNGLAAVLAARSPGAAKAAGRKVAGFDEERWERTRYGLVEASQYDRIWGIGIAATNPATHHPSAWRGRNLLGFALMDVRERP